MDSFPRSLVSLAALFLFAMSGCFGATLTKDFDYLVQPDSNSKAKINVAGTEYEVEAGDKIELRNDGHLLASQSPTCFYGYFNGDTLVIKVGYDPGATKPGGDAKYTPTFQEWAKGLSIYKLTITKPSGFHVEADIPYGEDGEISSAGFSTFAIRSGDSTASFNPLANYEGVLGSKDARGSALDRTVCFHSDTDPLLFEIKPSQYYLGTAAPIQNFDFQNFPIEPPKDEELKQQQDSAQQAPVAPTQTQPVAAGPAAAEGKGGCSLQSTSPGSFDLMSACILVGVLAGTVGAFRPRLRPIRRR